MCRRQATDRPVAEERGTEGEVSFAALQQNIRGGGFEQVVRYKDQPRDPANHAALGVGYHRRRFDEAREESRKDTLKGGKQGRGIVALMLVLVVVCVLV